MHMKPHERTAKLLASEHRKNDQNISHVFWLEHPREVRLIEVTSSVPRDETVMPFRFTEDPPEVPVPSLVVLIHPDDWARKEFLNWPQEIDPTKVTFTELEPENGDGN